jgi:endoglycosylceramidase
VAGYDIINEPFPGTASIANPYVSACSSQPGCPSFDRHTLEPFQVAIARAIRRFDRSRPVFFEPTFYFNGGTPTHFATPPAGVRPVGLSFHNQCPTRTAYSITHDPALIITGHTSCPPVSAQVFRNGSATAGTLGGPGLMTEVASTSDNDAEGLNCLFEQADHFQTGYTYGLSWSNPNDELRRLDEESGPTGVAPFKELVLARVYPRAVAGDPQSYGFDVRTGRFWLLYRARPRVRAPTVISIPTSVQYPGGYTVRVTGARQVSAADAQQLELVNDAHSRTVSVVVTPAPGSGISRPQFRACQLDPTSASG